MAASARTLGVSTLSERESSGDPAPEGGALPGRSPVARVAEVSFERAPAAPSASEAVWVTDVDGRVLHWNDTAERVYGWTAAEVLERDALELTVDVGSRAAAGALLCRAAAGTAASTELRMRGRDGGTFAARLTFAPLQDVAASVSAIVCVSRDISAEKAAEEAQRRMNAILQAQLDASPDGVLVFMDDRVVAVNTRFRELFAPPEDVLGQTTAGVQRIFRGILDEETQVRLIQENTGGDAVDQHEFWTLDGKLIRRSMRPILGPCGEEGRVSFYRDLTEERRAQLREQLQARLTGALAQLRDLALEAADVDGLLHGALPLIAGTLSVEGVELTEERRDGEVVSRARHGAVTATGGCSARVLGHDGSFGLLRVHAPVPRAFSVPELHFVDACAAVLATSLERSRAEAALRDSERRWRELVAQIPDGIAIVQGGQYVLVNDALARILGYASAAAVQGRAYADVLGPENAHVVRQRNQALATARGPMPRLEYTVRRPDGSAVILESLSMPLEYMGRPAGLSIVRDVTEHRQMQARLMVADRMASVGTLAAGVAHELNNPLAYVSGNLAFAARELGVDAATDPGRATAAELREALEDARDGAERMRQIIRDLKGFSRVDDEARSHVDVRRGVEAAINMAYNEVKQRARLERRLEEVPPVLADEGRIAQVVLNLLVNAAHAIPEGHPLEHCVQVSTGVLADGRVEIRVEDDGTGIAPEHLPRIFDPFFTTKPVGVGTGLGLSVCHNIVRALDGTIDVQTTLGRGSIFRVLLPPAQGAARTAACARPEPDVRPARILVIDDEPMILSVLRRSLSRRHQVELAHDGEEALRRLHDGERFDVLLCDVVMPGMSGAELYARMVERYPDQAAATLFMTGGAFTPSTREFLQHVPNPRIEKPFDPEALEALICKRLAGTEA